MVQLPIIITHLSDHASLCAPWFDHARLRSLRWSREIGRGTSVVPRLVARLWSGPLRHVAVPRSVVCPMQLRSFCVTEQRVPLRSLGPVGIRCLRPLPRPASDTIAGCRRKTAVAAAGVTNPRSPLGPPMPHRHARAFFSPEEDHFLHGPRSGVLRLTPIPATPAPPRPGAPGGSRCGTR